MDIDVDIQFDSTVIGVDIQANPQKTDGVCASARVSNSDDTFDENVASGGELELDDNTMLDSDGSTVVAQAAQTNFIATPCGVTPSGFAYCRAALTGQTTSYGLRDDGARQASGGYDFSGDTQTPSTVQRLDDSNRLLLEFNNSFGNKNRFTNDLGGSVKDGTDGSTVNYMIDNYTGDGWKVSIDTGVWTAAIADNVFGSFTDMFLPNYNELVVLADQENSDPMDYEPFNSTANVPFPTSTTSFNSTTVNYSLDNNTGRITTTAKSTFYVYFRKRKHF